MRHLAIAFALAILVIQVPLSGCIVDQFRPEPYEWRMVYDEKDKGAGTYTFKVAENAQRITLEIGATVFITTPLGETGGAFGISVNIKSPDDISHNYTFNGTGSKNDEFLGAAAGDWTITVTDYTGQNKVSIRVDSYEPKYSDWAWWKIWEN
ncbi:MAG: hypothetical protein PHH26_02810 [Candidatus Thermoplasmatota archaeon]|nr:hypothetical protein [Candidatus Thermoplasmatota archaeon]